ncbi:SlyX family protein [Modicisalibacter tunisiensis]|uniref:SlyX family protein n=2 Tax=Modicisalibacter TaxID=574347 RepID=UPI0013D18880|nr:SlyX family protein [Modicisalibacter tunisiensis]
MNGNTQRSDSSMIENDPLISRLEARIEALESRLAYQEHWLDTLDRAAVRREQRLSQLERINALMQQRLRDQHQALESLAPDLGAPDERPPHY